MDAPNVKSHYAEYTIVEFTQKYRAYIDPKESFPYTSSRGNQSILVSYNFNGSARIAFTLKLYETKMD